MAEQPLPPCASLPDGGRWFRLLVPMVEDMPQGAFPVAWDKNKSKVFGWYPNAHTFYDAISRLPINARHGYEAVLVSRTCKFFLDIEWVGSPDPGHSAIRAMLRALRAELATRLHINAEIYVCCSTRPTNDGFVKHSYHVVVDNLVFECSFDPQMRNLAQDINSLPEFETSGENSVVDLGVYTRNRLMRLPLCSKIGSGIPFRRISGDPYEDDIPCEADPADFEEAFAPFLLGNPPLNGDRLLVRLDPSFQNAPVIQAPLIQRKRLRADPAQRTFPLPLTVLEQALSAAGDEVSRATVATYQPESTDWQIQCDQRGAIRRCLTTEGTFHDSNNCMLFVKRKTQAYALTYRCLHPNCVQHMTTLGFISYSYEIDEWRFDQEEQVPKNEQQLDFSYEAVKLRFEEKNFKIENPSGYCCITEYDNRKFQFLSYQRFIHHHCNKYYETKDENGAVVRSRFVDRWIVDPTGRNVAEIVTDPEHRRENCYNLWPGILAESLPPIQDPDVIQELVEPIISHIEQVITSGERAHTEWLIDYLANVVHRPAKRTQVAILLYGQQGAGKGTIFEFLRLKVLGELVSYQTQDPRERLFGRFANGFLNRVLVQVDEVPNIYEYMEHLKNMITNDTLNYEQKGKDSVTVANLVNLVFTTNYENVLKITPGDRRFAFFRCSSDKVGDHEYFTRLRATLDDPRTPRAFYEFLATRDLSKYHAGFQSTRPVTNFYREAQQTNIPVPHRFLSAVINANLGPTIARSALYDLYSDFVRKGNYRHCLSYPVLMQDLTRVKGVTNAPSHNSDIHLAHATIRQELTRLKHYDPHITL